jgi:hypothetical protein
MKPDAVGMQVAPFWQGAEAQGLTATPVAGGATGPSGGTAPPGWQPYGPTPDPPYPGAQKHCTMPKRIKKKI